MRNGRAGTKERVASVRSAGKALSRLTKPSMSVSRSGAKGRAVRRRDVVVGPSPRGSPGTRPGARLGGQTNRSRKTARARVLHWKTTPWLDARTKVPGRSDERELSEPRHNRETRRLVLARSLRTPFGNTASAVGCDGLRRSPPTQRCRRSAGGGKSSCRVPKVPNPGGCCCNSRSDRRAVFVGDDALGLIP